MRIRLMGEDNKESQTTGRTLRSNVSISADERSSTPTKLIKKLDEGNKSTPNRGTKNISQSDVKLTPVRRSRRISKSEEPEEIDLSAIKSIKHSETIEEEVEEFDQDVNVVKNKPDLSTSLRNKLLFQAVKSHIDSPIPKATRRSRRVSREQSNDSFNSSKLAGHVEPILEDAENLSDSDGSSYSPKTYVKKSRTRKELRTRALSSDVESPRRVSRRLSATSDDESVISVASSSVITRGKRQSVAALPTVENIKEEIEELNSHELELRNRSVSRSPVVSQSDSPSSSKPKQISPLALNKSKTVKSDENNRSVTFYESVPDETSNKLQYAKTPRKSTTMNTEESIEILDSESEEDDDRKVNNKVPKVILNRVSLGSYENEDKLSKSLGPQFEQAKNENEESLCNSKDMNESANNLKVNSNEILTFEDSNSQEEVPSSQPPCIGSEFAQCHIKFTEIPNEHGSTDLKTQELIDIDQMKKWLPDQTIQDNFSMEIERKSPYKSRETTVFEEAMELSGNVLRNNESIGSKGSVELSNDMDYIEEDKASENTIQENMASETVIQEETVYVDIHSEMDIVQEESESLVKVQSPIKDQSLLGEDSPSKIPCIEDELNSNNKTRSPKKSPRKSIVPTKSPEKKSPMKSAKNTPSRKSLTAVEEDATLDETIQSPEFSPVVKKTPKISEKTGLDKSLTSSATKTLETQTEELRTKSPKIGASWTQVVTGNTEASGIDPFAISQESPVKVTVRSPKKAPKKRDLNFDSDEEEYSENEEGELNDTTGFLDDEAEENSNDSMTESERLYIAENQISSHGIDLGSEDTDDNSADEIEEEENSLQSFICTDEENDQNQYIMDEDENELEFGTKRFSRIRKISTSSEDGVQIKTSPQKRRSIHDQSKNSEQINDEQIGKKELHKNKRRHSTLLNQTTEINEHKRLKLSDTIENSSSDDVNLSLNATDVDIGSLFNSTQNIQSPPKSSKKVKNARMSLTEQDVVKEAQQEIEVSNTQKTSKKSSKHIVSLDAIMTFCSQHVDKVEEQKKINKSIKKKKKEEKRKQKEAESALLGESGEKPDDDVALKKKKKKKAKKPQEIEIVKPSGMSETLKNHEETLERRRLRKKEKKLAKVLKNEQETFKIQESVEIAIVPVEEPEKKKKKKKKSDVEPQVDAPESSEISVEVREKKKKKKSTVVEGQSVVSEVPEISTDVSAEISDKKKKKKKKKATVEEEVSSPDAKNNKENEASFNMKTKPKKKKLMIHESEKSSDAPNGNTENSAVPKHGKRTYDETVFNDETEGYDVTVSKKPKMISKKLNVLGQLESSGSTTSFQVEPRTPELSSKFGFKEGPKTPIPIGFKVKNLVPKVLADRIEKKKRKRTSAMKRKTYDEVNHALPKPVFSTVSGLWMEESVEIPVVSSVVSSGSTKFSVVPLMAKKKFSALGNAVNVPAAFDFRSKALSRLSNVRDTSNKKTAQNIFKQGK